MTTKTMTAPHAATRRSPSKKSDPKSRPPCPAPMPCACSLATRNIFRRPIPALIRWLPRADAASSSPTSTATSSIDFSAGIAVTSTGHCHPDVVAAIQKQAGELIHMSGTDFYYESLVATRRAPVEDRSHARPAQVLLWQFRRRGHRVRAEAGPVSHQEAEHHRVLRRVSRTHHGRAVADRLEAAAAPPLFAAHAGRDSRSISRPLSRTPRCRAGSRRVRAQLRTLHRRKTLQDHAASRGSGGDLRRAGAGRRRLRGRADDLHAGAAPHLRSSWHHAGAGRSAERHRPHRQVVGGRAHRRRAGHGLHGEGPCLGHAPRHHA